MPGQQKPLLSVVQLHGSRRLKPLPDPVDLVKVVDVHVLRPNAPAVHILQPVDDLLEGQGSLIFSSNEGGLWQLEHCLHVLIKIYVRHQITFPDPDHAILFL